MRSDPRERGRMVDVRQTLKKVTFLNRVYTKLKWREQRKSWGKENSDKIFYVIRRATCKVGLFSYVMTNMGLVKDALEKGYIPVIDMCGNANTYLEEDEIGEKNAWEFYFEQPCGYTLDDISRSKNIILSNGLITGENQYPGEEIIWDRENRDAWKKIFRKYFHIRREIIEETEALFERMFQGGRVLGVLCRGTDYVNSRPKNHPVQPETEMVIVHASKIMKEYHCEWIYLATEDDIIYRKFSEAFGKKLKVTSARRSGDVGKRNINDVLQQKGSRYQGGKDYLINIMLLAKCNCLVAGSAGGTYGALLLNEIYEYEYIFKLGVYG